MDERLGGPSDREHLQRAAGSVEGLDPVAVRDHQSQREVSGLEAVVAGHCAHADTWFDEQWHGFGQQRPFFYQRWMSNQPNVRESMDMSEEGVAAMWSACVQIMSIRSLFSDQMKLMHEIMNAIRDCNE